MHLLLIEDEEIDYINFKRLMKKGSGNTYSITHAMSFKDALEILQSQPFDIIVSDLNLPDKKGIDLLKNLSEEAQDIPIIILTGLEDDSLLKEVSQYEVYDYLVKDDVTPKTLKRSIQYALERFNANKSRKDMEEQLLHSQRMDSLGKLTGGVAHDFNNKLAVLSLQIQRLTQVKNNDSEFDGHHLRIQDTIDRLKKITKQLLAYSRKQELKKERRDISHVLQNSMELVTDILPANISIKSDLYASSVLCKIDDTQIDQVIINAILNARDAIGDQEGSIHVSTSITSHIPSSLVKEKSLSTTDYFKIVIEDDGCGMNQQDLLRACEPFFTTKKIHEGSGLGLSVIDGIVNQHDGFLQLESEEGQGTKLTAYFPIHEIGQLAPTSEEVLKPKTLSKKSLKILIVDDEPEIRTCLGDVLECDGFEILTAEDGQQGLETFLSHCESIDLVITDIMMPKMGGMEFFQEVRKTHPNMKFLFMSGYSQNQITGSNGTLPEGTRFMEKPFLGGTVFDEIELLISSDSIEKAS